MQAVALLIYVCSRTKPTETLICFNVTSGAGGDTEMYVFGRKQNDWIIILTQFVIIIDWVTAKKHFSWEIVIVPIMCRRDEVDKLWHLFNPRTT